MRANDYSAVRKTGTDVFAIYPLPVSKADEKLPYDIKRANATQSVRMCPTGLLKATVIEDNVKWMEDFTLGCGDQTYQRERRNGVLVSIALDAVQERNGKLTEAAIKRMPQTRIVKHVVGGVAGKAVHMIVAKSCLMAPWGEYELIEAERDKEREDRDVRAARLGSAVKAIGALRGDYFEMRGEEEEKPELVDYTVRASWGTTHLRGRVEISLRRAEQIGQGIEALGAGDAKKALKLLATA